MVALFVILTFAVMLLIDHLLLRQPIVVAEGRQTARSSDRPRLVPAVVGGFEVPDNLRYHPGHTWAAQETAELVRIGVDDFASRLAGKAERIDAPSRGQWVRQGQKILSFFREGREISLVSPIEGTVVGVNDAAIDNPELASKDPYGEGWLLEIHSPDAKTNFRNLFGGALARHWMEDAAARLRSLSPAFAGAYAQDGGVAIDDTFAHLSDADWATAQKEFFLTV